MQEGKPGGGKGPLLSEDRSLTIATGNDQTLFQPLAFVNQGGQTNLGLSEDLSPPVTGSNGNPPHVFDGYAVRKLLPLECERLQGFPDGWTQGHSDTARYRMIGNAVAVPVVEWIARRLVGVA
jgi:DNA (cytosine-5)-methyltransferase 1